MTQFYSPPMPAKPLKSAGIGLRGKHYEDIVAQKPDIGWIEVHPENYFGGGYHRHHLAKARELYALSFHAVGMSLGSDEAVDEAHIKKIKELSDIFEPFQISDHVSWSASGNAHLNDLLPLPYTRETLKKICENIDRVQMILQRPILVENPSTYLSFQENDMHEDEFLNLICQKTGCALLLDINNIYVQSKNHNFSAEQYVLNIKEQYVQEIHLAGHTKREFDDGTILVDTHNKPVCDDVWELYKSAIDRFGETPTLIEWDGDIPPLARLVEETSKAQKILDLYHKNNTQEHVA